MDIGLEFTQRLLDALSQRGFVPPECLLLFLCQGNPAVTGSSHDPSGFWVDSKMNAAIVDRSSLLAAVSLLRSSSFDIDGTSGGLKEAFARVSSLRRNR